MRLDRITPAARILALTLSLALVLLAVLGCTRPAPRPRPEPRPAPTPTPTQAPEPTPTPTPTPEPTTPPTVGTRDVLVYLTRGEKLGVATRRVPKTQGVAAEAVRALLSDTTEEDRKAGLATAVPRGTRLNGLKIANGVATVDLSKEFESGGGSLSMRLRIAQVVYTLTQFPTVTRVGFKIDGRSVDAIGGEGIVVSPPVTRADFRDDVLPLIFVESPTPWQRVSSPFRLRGMSNTFEATYRYKLTDASGRVMVDAFGTATAGTGTWGTFDSTVRFKLREAGDATLTVFESSAKDGSPINVVKIPLRLTP